jgi:hypothetical protein
MDTSVFNVISSSFAIQAKIWRSDPRPLALLLVVVRGVEPPDLYTISSKVHRQRVVVVQHDSLKFACLLFITIFVDLDEVAYRPADDVYTNSLFD